jgi:hypothetical protein
VCICERTKEKKKRKYERRQSGWAEAFKKIKYLGRRTIESGERVSWENRSLKGEEDWDERMLGQLCFLGLLVFYRYPGQRRNGICLP